MPYMFRKGYKLVPATRRRALKFLSALLLAVVGISPTAAATRRTPLATEGPFYPRPAVRFTDADNDLSRLYPIN